MILRDIDLHLVPRMLRPWSRRHQRVRRLVEALWVRLPRTVAERIETGTFTKLNVEVVAEPPTGNEFWVWERIGMATVHEPSLSRLLSLGDKALDAWVIDVLQRGIEVAARHDETFARRSGEVVALAARCAEPIESVVLTKALRRRGWRGELVLLSSPAALSIQARIVEVASGAVLARQRVRAARTMLELMFDDAPDPFVLNWRDDCLEVSTDRSETFVLEPRTKRSPRRG